MNSKNSVFLWSESFSGEVTKQDGRNTKRKICSLVYLLAYLLTYLVAILL